MLIPSLSLCVVGLHCVCTKIDFLSLVGAAARIIFVATKALSPQTHVTKPIFLSVMTNICCDKHNFVTTSILLSQQTHVCLDKIHLLLQQKCACCDKTFAMTKDYFVMTNACATTNTCLSRQKFCHDKNVTCGSSRQSQFLGPPPVGDLARLRPPAAVHAPSNKGSGGSVWRASDRKGMCSTDTFDFLVRQSFFFWGSAFSTDSLTVFVQLLWKAHMDWSAYPRLWWTYCYLDTEKYCTHWQEWIWCCSWGSCEFPARE